MRHIPVLLDEIIVGLNLKSGMNVIDCTLGDGGHAEKILEKIIPNGKLLGIDVDPESLLQAKQYLYRFSDNFIGVRDNFVNLDKIIRDNNWEKITAILMDLGWSWSQFANRERGFSFQNMDEPLDMRFYPGNMQSEESKTATDIVNNYSEEELERIFRKYGEERNSGFIAKRIVELRKKASIETVGDLVNIFSTQKNLSLTRRSKIHPATRVFQALRIEVNNELEVLRQALPQAIKNLDSQGRLAVISFHSLEDRIVKQFFQKQVSLNKINLINKKPIIASAEELRQNYRARSAKLRIIEKI